MTDERNPASLTLGIISIVVATISLLVSWLPLLGLISIAGALLAILLAGIGLVLAIIKRKGFILPLIGGVLAVVPIVVSLTITGLVTTALDESRKNINANQAQQDEANAMALSLVEVSDIEIKRSSISGNPRIAVGYTLTNNGTDTLKVIKTQIFFMDKDENVVYEKPEIPIGFLDPSIGPGQMSVQIPNEFMYSNVPADRVSSVRIEVTEVDIVD